MGTHAIKFKENGGKSWWFVKNDGYGTRKKIHAPTMSLDAANTAAKRMRDENPEFQFRVVEFATGKVVA